MTSPPLRWAFAGAGFVALASLGAVGTLPLAAATRDWFTTFSSTLVSVALAAALGIWEFGREARINDDNERDRLQMTCAIETQLNVSVLGEPPAEILASGTGATVARARLVHLPLGALEELARSGLEDPEMSSGLVWTVAHMRKQNGDVANLLGMQGGVITRAAIFAMTRDINRRQQLIKDLLESLLERLEEALKEEGKELPPIVQPDDRAKEPFVSADEARGFLRGED